jgi:hypothetical protein
MIDAQTISIIFAGLSIGIAAIRFTLTLQNTQRNQELTRKAQEQAVETRQAQLFMNIYERFTDKGFWDMVNEIREFEYEDVDDFEKKYGQYEKNKAWAITSVFEGIGVLLKRELIDIQQVNDLMPLTVMSVWEKLEPLIMEARRSEWDSKYAYKGFEYLNNAVVETYEQHLRDWDT